MVVFLTLTMLTEWTAYSGTERAVFTPARSVSRDGTRWLPQQERPKIRRERLIEAG